jgi:uncharacterized protein
VLDRFAERWALVTGASSGIGSEFAQRLAARGMHLVLTARREERLHELAEDLHTRHGAKSIVLPGDLGEPETVDRLCGDLGGRGIEVELLVNNAGFAVVEGVETTDVDRVVAMLRLNVEALTRLTYRLLPGMLERRHGGIVNVASTAGFQPVAYMGPYAASKAYVLHFSEALWAEARDRGVTVMALCPGITKTDFFEVAGVGGWLKKRRAASPEQVVKVALRALEKRKPAATCTWRDFLTTVLVRLASRKMVVTESMKYFRPQAGDEPADDVETTSVPSAAASAAGDAAAVPSAESSSVEAPVAHEKAPPHGQSKSA